MLGIFTENVYIYCEWRNLTVTELIDFSNEKNYIFNPTKQLRAALYGNASVYVCENVTV